MFISKNRFPLFRNVLQGSFKGACGRAKVAAAMDGPFGDDAIDEHCLPFNVSRAFDEASGIDHPRIWTAERDVAMWRELQKG